MIELVTQVPTSYYFTSNLTKNISNTRMHSSRMRTAHSLPYGGCLSSGVPLTALDTDPPRKRSPTGHVTSGAYWDRDSPPLLWTEFLTHACENITLPQLRYGR